MKKTRYPFPTDFRRKLLSNFKVNPHSSFSGGASFADEKNISTLKEIHSYTNSFHEPYFITVEGDPVFRGQDEPGLYLTGLMHKDIHGERFSNKCKEVGLKMIYWKLTFDDPKLRMPYLIPKKPGEITEFIELSEAALQNTSLTNIWMSKSFPVGDENISLGTMGFGSSSEFDIFKTFEENYHGFHITYNLFEMLPDVNSNVNEDFLEAIFLYTTPDKSGMSSSYRNLS